jgi:trimethylamine--corrinoid protein Co-methyltransferase
MILQKRTGIVVENQGVFIENEEALDLFKDFATDTQFLSMPHTRKWYREEHTFPKLIDREPYEIWVSKGRKSITDRAKEEVENLLLKNPPALPDTEIQKALREIMLSDARKNGIPSLPEIDLP